MQEANLLLLDYPLVDISVYTTHVLSYFSLTTIYYELNGSRIMILFILELSS